MKTKLYRATQIRDVIFCSSVSGSALASEADYYLHEEYSFRSSRKSGIVVSEVTLESQVPGERKDEMVWGDDKERTPSEFLRTNEEDEEYEEYLRLKKKFAHKELARKKR